MGKKAAHFLTIVLLISSTCTLVTAQNIQKSVIKSKKAKSVSPENFNHADIGNPAIAGTMTKSGNGFDITAGGADIWGKKDEFTFVYIERSGDFDLISCIEGLTAPHLYTKAGLMAREDLTAGSRHLYFQIFPDNNPRNKNNGGFEFQYRLENGGEMKAIYPDRYEGIPDFPVTFPDTWIRLQRIRNEFTGYCSSDGRNWKVYTTFSMELPVKIYLGLAVTSHKTTDYAVARFRNIGEIKH